jgi:hypothetical protein
MIKTTQRIAAFRENYLIRDYHRYVIIRKFDYIKAKERFRRERDDKTENNNKYLFKNEAGIFISLKIVYIFLYSLINVRSRRTELIDIHYI